MSDTAKLFYLGLKETNGREFRAIFTKKDGSERVLVGRTRVSKGVNGRGMSYDPKSRGLMPVFDMQKGAWRMVNTNTMTSLKCGGIDINI